MANQVVWFDITVLDLDRAILFYSAVLGAPVQKDVFDGNAMGVLPHRENEVAGCLYTSDSDKPSASGPLLYFNCDGRLDEAVAAVTEYGGQILRPKHSIGPHGSRAIVLDSEGNRIALHSR